MFISNLLFRRIIRALYVLLCGYCNDYGPDEYTNTIFSFNKYCLNLGEQCVLYDIIIVYNILTGRSHKKRTYVL